MSVKYSASFLNDAVKLFDGDRTLKEVSGILKCNPDNLSKALRANGISVPFGKKPSHNRKYLPENEIVELYTSGMSELAIAKALMVSRTLIRRILTAHGVKIRGKSEASFMATSQSSFEERQARAKAANEALRGRTYSHQECIKRAVSRSEKGSAPGVEGVGEQEVYDFLVSLGFEVERQKACDIYNIDLVVGAVAVEIKSGASDVGPTFANKDSGRIKKISKSGFSVLYVCFTDLNALIASLDEIVVQIEQMRWNPPALGKYRVIGCRLQDYAIVRNERQQFSRIPAPIKLVNTLREVDY